MQDSKNKIKINQSIKNELLNGHQKYSIFRESLIDGRNQQKAIEEEQIKKTKSEQYHSKSSKYWLQVNNWVDDKCTLLNLSRDPQTLSLTELSLLLANQDGCIHYNNHIFYYDQFKDKLTEIEPELAGNLHSILNRMAIDKPRMTRDNRELESITAATGRTHNTNGIQGQTSAYEYGTAMTDLCAGYALLNKALSYDNMITRGVHFIWNESIGQTKAGQRLATTAGDIANLPGKLSDILLQGFKLKKEDIPKIIYSIEIDEDGVLTTQVTKDGEPLSLQEQMIFDAGLIAWAEKRGYTFDEDTQILKDNQGLIMTADNLRALNQNDGEGLNAFFEDRLDLEVSSAPRPVCS